MNIPSYSSWRKIGKLIPFRKLTWTVCTETCRKQVFTLIRIVHTPQIRKQCTGIIFNIRCHYIQSKPYIATCQIRISGWIISSFNRKIPATILFHCIAHHCIKTMMLLKHFVISQYVFPRPIKAFCPRVYSTTVHRSTSCNRGTIKNLFVGINHINIIRSFELQIFYNIILYISVSSRSHTT